MYVWFSGCEILVTQCNNPKALNCSFTDYAAKSALKREKLKANICHVKASSLYKINNNSKYFIFKEKPSKIQHIDLKATVELISFPLLQHIDLISKVCNENDRIHFSKWVGFSIFQYLQNQRKIHLGDT